MGTLAFFAMIYLLWRLIRRDRDPDRASADSDAALREKLAGLRRIPIPRELRGMPPRPDVFSGRGYLRDHGYRHQYLELLRNGSVARALCIAYRRREDSEGPDVKFTYAWLDDDGNVRRATQKESYDATHAAWSPGEGQIVVDMDADMHLGKELTVVYWPDAKEHVIYEALLIDAAQRPL